MLLYAKQNNKFTKTLGGLHTQQNVQAVMLEATFLKIIIIMILNEVLSKCKHQCNS
jgi:hypothetical protein